MATATLPETAFPPNRLYDHYFFSLMALVILAVVFVGFARTYFMAGVFAAPLPNLLIHIHGAVFPIWILLLVTQTALVAGHRVDIHRRLGVFGFCLAGAMVVLGELAARDQLLRGGPPGFPFDPRTFYAIPAIGIMIFGTLVYFAYRMRSNPAAHKRLILLANIAILDAPTGRPPFSIVTHRPHLDAVFVYALLLPLIAYDLWSLRRLHKATIWGGLFVVIAQAVRVPIGMTHRWLAFAGWVQHFGH